ncbi:MAG: 3-oxosteroid 1-dehydrogenase [Pseudonocardiales bacterium]|jgi:succinate dehydrogenase/fumarate reductase flavoprotein subunit|nr:3-oxosteroid 1-dehydrogenase [Pseudonocardiales bacterium]
MSTEFDVVVVGSGASGLMAALSAAVNGESVAVLEKAPVFGGTSVVSGGSIWAPSNKYADKAGGQDDREDALTYLRRVTLGRVEDDLLVRFVDTINPMLDFLETETGLEFTPNMEHPDYQPALAGARSGGRTIQVGLYDSTRLGDVRTDMRPTHSTVPITKHELDEWGMDTLDRWNWALIADRTKNHITGMGAALVGELLEACLRHGVQVFKSTPAQELIESGGRIVGVRAGAEGATGGSTEYTARHGVVLASGGFEWNEKYVQRFLGVPMIAPGSPPSNEGDGLRMAMTVGAALGNMTEAWWGPMLDVVGDTYDGRPLHRTTSGIRTLPGSLVVNRAGKRFVNEAMNYNDFVKAMAHFDPVSYEYENVPCWLIFDQHYRASYSVGTLTPDGPKPDWVHTAGTLPELARALGIDEAGFAAQLERFNADAARGEDPEFHRGETTYDRYRGDKKHEPHRNLGPLTDGPYYAVELQFGCIGTKGGPIVDVNGRVVDAQEKPLPGLYACGNVAASIFGPGYPGAGSTLAAGMAMAYVIGQQVAAG